MKLFNVESWERTRNAGRKRFVLQLVGIYVAFVFLLAVFWYWRMAAAGLFSLMPGFRSGTVWISVALVLVGAPLFGWIWGMLMWQIMDAIYRRLMGREAGA